MESRSFFFVAQLMISFLLITWWTLFLPPYEIFYWSFKSVFADFYEWFHDGFMLYFADVCFFVASFILWWIWLNCWICFFRKKKDKRTKVSCFSSVFFTLFWLHLFWNKCVSPGSKHLGPSLRIQMPQFSMPEGNLRGPIEQVPQMLPMSASYQTPLQFAQMMSVPQFFFPTCQVRVVRFYVSLFSSSSSSSSFSSFSSASSSVSLSCRESVCSVWHVGPQLRSCEFSVACWTPTAILVSAVWRAGPQPRSCVFSVACRTPTAILRVQCGVPDPNRDPANSVWRPGPQPRSCEFSVASRTPTAILWVQCGVPDLKYCVRKFVRKNDRRYVRKNDRRYVRRYVKKICQKICQKECQKICQKSCQKMCQKECQKICPKECREICQKI